MRLKVWRAPILAEKPGSHLQSVGSVDVRTTAPIDRYGGRRVNGEEGEKVRKRLLAQGVSQDDYVVLIPGVVFCLFTRFPNKSQRVMSVRDS